MVAINFRGVIRHAHRGHHPSQAATFCLGQLVSHEPQLISELSFAHTVVEGLSCALRKGWNVHHGVGKFAANALTILSISEAAVPAVREFAIDELLHGLAQW